MKGSGSLAWRAVALGRPLVFHTGFGERVKSGPYRDGWNFLRRSAEQTGGSTVSLVEATQGAIVMRPQRRRT